MFFIQALILLQTITAGPIQIGGEMPMWALEKESQWAEACAATIMCMETNTVSNEADPIDLPGELCIYMKFTDFSGLANKWDYRRS